MVFAALCVVLNLVWIFLAIKFDLPDEKVFPTLMLSICICFFASIGTITACLRAKARGDNEDLWMVVMAIPILLISGIFLAAFLFKYVEIQDRTGTYGGRGGSSTSLVPKEKTAAG